MCRKFVPVVRKYHCFLNTISELYDQCAHGLALATGRDRLRAEQEESGSKEKAASQGPPRKNKKRAASAKVARRSPVKRVSATKRKAAARRTTSREGDTVECWRLRSPLCFLGM
jgi:hypothetical protein